MKKLLVLLAVGSLVLFIAANKAFATVLDPSTEPYMTEQQGSFAQEDTFGWNETPFAFIGFDVIDLNPRGPLELTWSWYFDKDINNEIFVASESQRITSFGTGPSLNIWNAPDDWDTLKQLGDWKTTITWENRVLGGRGGWGSSIINYTVTPEPASSLLFLFGGATMALRYYRRKRKSA